VVIVLDSAGKQAVAKSAVTQRLLDQGIAVLAMDARATGEGKVKENQCASDAIMLGRPLLAQQAWDVISAAQWLAKRQGFQRVAVYGQGPMGLVAMLAVGLSDDIHALAVDQTVGSFVDMIADPLPQPLWAYAPSILKVADTAQLVALCAPRPVLCANPVNGSGKPTASEETAPDAITGFLATALKKP
jgi:hypothetical protein